MKRGNEKHVFWKHKKISVRCKWAAIHCNRWGSSTLGWYLRVTEGGARRLIYNAVLRELYRSVVTKRELSNTAELSVFKSVFVPILTYGDESWVMTEKIISGASGRDGIFAKSPRHNTGAYRGEMAPRARNKFGASCSNLRPFRKCTVLKKNLRHYWGLLEPPSHPVHWELCVSFTPHYTPGLTLCDQVRCC